MGKDFREYQTALSFVFKKEFYNWYDIQENSTSAEAESYWNSIILKKVVDVENKLEINPRYLEELDLDEKFINYFKANNSAKKICLDKCLISKIEYVLSFIHQLQTRKLNKDMSDKYAICCGFESYVDFQNKYDSGEVVIPKTLKKESKQKQLEVMKEDEFHPMKNDYLKMFFERDCYVYAYDEDLAEGGEETDTRTYHYPNIDALVLSFDGAYFTLKNINGKSDHKIGQAKWCGGFKNKKKENVAFEIVFKESPNDLTLRIHFPYKKLKKESVFDLMLGAFTMSEKGNIAIGKILIYKEKTKGKKSFKYEFKQNKHKYKVKPIIQEYLFDRYKNWIKVPSKKAKLSDLYEWLTKKNGKNYTHRKITLYDYLITCPNTSFEVSGSDRNKLVGEIQKIIKDPISSLTNDEFLEKNHADKLVEYIEEKKKNNKIYLYPKSTTSRKNTGKINRDFFRKLNSAINVIVVIPKATYERTSSIYTVIGYCIALKKKTFVFYENEVEMPNLLSRSEPSVNLFVKEYKKVSDIPRLMIELDETIKTNWMKKDLDSESRT
jgi:hypothetical protein